MTRCNRFAALGTAIAILVFAIAPSLTASPQQPPMQGPPPLATGTGLIAGQVVDAGSGEGVAGIQVILLPNGSPTGSARVNADSKGRFFFGQLPARAFNIQTVSLTGVGTIFAAGTGHGRLVALDEGERVTGLKIGVLHYGAISGTVRDDAGDPVVGMAMAAFQRSATPGRAGFRGTTRTDDRGEYVIDSLPPGEYLVCACGNSALPLDGTVLTTLAAQPLLLLAAAGRAAKVGSGVVQQDGTLRTYAPAFHPASRVSTRADRVVITSGLRRQGVDIAVTAVRMARVSGRVTGATGPLRANEIRLRPVDEDPSTPMPAIPAMLVQADGRFDFANVSPGEYRLDVNHFPGTGAGAPSGTALALLGARGAQMNADAFLGLVPPDAIPEWGLATISVGEHDVTDLVVPLQPAATVRGRVQFIGSTPPAAADRISRMSVQMASIAPYSSEQTFMVAPARLAADGSFTLRGASPSQYLARAVSTAPWVTVASVSVDGRDITDLPLEMTGADVHNLTITMSDAVQATAPGRVVGDAAPGVAEPLAVIFPADRKQWTHIAASRRFGNFPVDQKGRFTIIAPEGEYFVAVIADVYGVVWRDAERLEALSRTATRTTLAPGTNPLVEVRR